MSRSGTARTARRGAVISRYGERVARDVRLREFLIAIEGLALHRRLYDGTDVEAQQRLAEIEQLLTDSAYARGEPIQETAPQPGYQRWSVTYDER